MDMTLSKLKDRRQLILTLSGCPRGNRNRGEVPRSMSHLLSDSMGPDVLMFDGKAYARCKGRVTTPSSVLRRWIRPTVMSSCSGSCEGSFKAGL